MSDTMRLQFSSVTELLHKARIDYKGKKPINVYKRLSDMRELAEKAKNIGDEETEYIMLRRWLDSVEWLKKTQEYKDDKSIYLVNMRVNQINEVKTILADLTRRLDVRYKQHLKEKMLEKSKAMEPMELNVDTDMGIDTYMSSIDGPIKLPETPTKDPLSAENEEFITCDQVYQLLQKQDSRCLVIDVRPKVQYEVSRISSDKCINIPDDEIKRGVLPSHLEKYLRKDSRSLDLFKHRGAQYVDVIVLLDWDTTSKTLTKSTKLSVLKHIFEEWDPGIKYNRITVLDGGYCEWLARYPAFTTNPNVAEPSTNNIENEILEDIVYPDWAHSDDEDTVMKTHSSKVSNLKNKNEKTLKTDVSNEKIRFKPSVLKTTTIIPSNKNNDFTNPVTTQSTEIEKIPRKSGTNLRQYENDSFKLNHKRTSSAAKQTDVLIKPTIDRSSKPVSLKTSTAESKIVLELLKELHQLAKQKGRLEEEILEQERSLYMQHGKYRSFNEEQYIRGILKSLYGKLEEAQMSYTKVEDELNRYNKDMDSIKFTTEEKKEKDLLNMKILFLKYRIMEIAAEREKLREKSIQNEYKELTIKENESSIHKEPLKTDNTAMGGGLERSYSSPNLLQLGDRKAPRVDRSSKPQISPHNQNGTIGSDSTKVSHITWANREERMTPVHGSVHPGITGLKNLGNSCYMNSIIQCLSNTTHLAKYFTDNLYADDLNTNNDSTTQGQVVEEVAQVIKALWRGQYKSISPHDLKVAVGQYKLQFESYEQQDSHEFLTFLLDWMHNDLKKETKMPIEMTVAEKAWDKAMGSQKSIISDLFFGQLRSTITCSFCKQSSTTYETFNSLTMSLPHSSRCTLNDCILKFVTGQKVVGWKCPKCQMPREATKKFDFVKLAPVIVIHLNRFAESGGWLEKRNTAVDFPLTGFNLKQYLVTDNNTATISNIRSYSYSLYAMSNHYGTMEGGHYTAFCKNAAQNKWYKYDDQTVTEVTASQVRSQNTSAYLLFYTSFSSNII